MARFSYADADNYGTTNGSSFFSLKDDGDVARVRFMYNGIEDVEGYAVHEVMIGDKRRYVNCLRSYNEPKSKCPFCANGSYQKAKLYVPVYDEDNHEAKLWERGKKFFGELSSLCARYGSKTPLVSQVFEIERRGKKGDTSTTYGIYPIGNADDTTLADLPEIPEIVGGIILDKTAEDMEYFLDEGEFPEAQQTNSRRSSREEEQPVRRETRRTPSRSEQF